MRETGTQIDKCRCVGIPFQLETHIKVLVLVEWMAGGIGEGFSFCQESFGIRLCQVILIGVRESEIPLYLEITGGIFLDTIVPMTWQTGTTTGSQSAVASQKIGTAIIEALVINVIDAAKGGYSTPVGEAGDKYLIGISVLVAKT